MKHIYKEFLLLISITFLIIVIVALSACGGGWEVCGYELDKV